MYHIRLFSCLFVFSLVYFHHAMAEGIPELKPFNDNVRLLINRTSDSGGERTNFAGWGNTDPFSRLYINIQDPTSEYIYIGLGLSDFNPNINVDNNPDYDGSAIRYRLYAPNGVLVVDRVVSLNDWNITGATDDDKFDNALNGPSEITSSGYTAGPDFTVSLF